MTARIEESNDVASGFNAASESDEDLARAGMVDPAKVVGTALQNAASIASRFLTTLVAGDSEGENGGCGATGGAWHV